MWIKIRTVLIAVLLHSITLKALAGGAGLKAFVDTKDTKILESRYR